jgi:hypothetical protein
MNSRTGGSNTRSAAMPMGVGNSDLLRFSTKSSIAGDSQDGVWTAQNPSGRKVMGLDTIDSGRQRAPSVASSAISTGTTGTAWDEVINAGRPEQSYRSRIASGRTSNTAQTVRQSEKWAKQGAVKPDAGALRAAERQREAQRKVDEQERARREEDDSSDSEWEL